MMSSRSRSQRRRIAACAALLALLPASALAQASAVPPDSTGLTLADVERGVLAANPTIAAQRQRVAAARARAEAAGAWSDPELSFMAAPSSLGADDPRSAYRFELTQRIAPFGVRGAEQLEAGANFDAASADADAARLDLLREARVAFAEYRRATDSRRVHAAMVDLAAQLRQVALSKYAAGVVEQQDPLAASVEAARLAHHAAQLDREARIAAARLNALLGRPATAPLPPPAPSDEPASMSAPGDPDSLARRARATRPEVQAAVSRVAAGAARQRVADKERWPGLMFGAVYDRYMDDPGMRTSFEVGVELPLFGGRGALRQAAAADVAAAEAEHRARLLDVEREVAEALAGVEESEHELEVMDRGVLPAAEQSVATLRTSYSANRASFLVLLDAMRSLAEARLDRIDVIARRDVARADLARALGEDPAIAGMEGMR